MTQISRDSEQLTQRIARLKQRQNGSKENAAPEIKRPRGRPKGSRNASTANARKSAGSKSRKYSDDISGNDEITVTATKNNGRKFTGNIASSTDDAGKYGRIVNDNYNIIGNDAIGNRKTAGSNSGYDTRGNNTTSNSTRFTSSIKKTLKDKAQSGLRIVSKVGTDEDETESFLDKINPIPKVVDFAHKTADTIIQDAIEDFNPDEKRDDIIDMLIGWGKDLNNFLTISNQKHAHNKSEGICDIWDLDRQEAGYIANIWIKRAKRDEKTAAILHMALDGNDYFRAIMVLGERGLQTIPWYSDNDGFDLTHWRKS